MTTHEMLTNTIAEMEGLAERIKPTIHTSNDLAIGYATLRYQIADLTLRMTALDSALVTVEFARSLNHLLDTGKASAERAELAAHAAEHSATRAEHAATLTRLTRPTSNNPEAEEPIHDADTVDVDEEVRPVERAPRRRRGAPAKAAAASTSKDTEGEPPPTPASPDPQGFEEA